MIYLFKKLFSFLAWYHEGLIKYDEHFKDMDPRTKDHMYRAIFGRKL